MIDTMLVYMIKETSTKNSQLGQTLEHLKHTDHSLLKAGFACVKALIEEDYAPSGHLIKAYSRERTRNSWREFKEKPKWWFRRFDRYMEIAQSRDSEFRFTSDELATHYLNHSGLDQKERK